MNEMVDVKVESEELTKRSLIIDVFTELMNKREVSYQELSKKQKTELISEIAGELPLVKRNYIVKIIGNYVKRNRFSSVDKLVDINEVTEEFGL